MTQLALLLLEFLICESLMGIGQFIYDYQTLIAGIGAIGAAYIAAKPVYSQLGLMRTQSDGVFREMLLQRQLELQQASVAVTENVEGRLNDLSAEFPWYDEDEETELTTAQAHHYDQLISGTLRWLRLSYRWRDSPASDEKKNSLIQSLEVLVGHLENIYFTDSHQQVDGDHTIDDETWAGYEARGVESNKQVYPALRNAKAALNAYRESFQSELDAIDRHLKKLDRSLIVGA